MQNKRATIVGIIVGAVILAALAAYAIGLPKVEGTLPTLPDRLGDNFVAISAATPQQLGATAAADQEGAAQFSAGARKQDQKAADHLADLYGGDATIRSYIDVSQLSRLQQGQLPPEIAVTVAKTGVGLVIPSGPLQVDQDAQHYALKKVDGYQCAVTYADPQQATPTTQATGTTYQQTECRTSSGGLTYDIFGSNVSADDVAGYLHDLIEG